MVQKFITNMKFEKSDTFKCYQENCFMLEEAFQPLMALSKMSLQFLTKNLRKCDDLYWKFDHFTTDDKPNLNQRIHHSDAMRMGSQFYFFKESSAFKSLQKILKRPSEGNNCMIMKFK